MTELQMASSQARQLLLIIRHVECSGFATALRSIAASFYSSATTRGMGEESVVADEPCEAAIGCEAIVKSASTVNQAYRMRRFCDRFALERSLVLLVNCYAVV